MICYLSADVVEEKDLKTNLLLRFFAFHGAPGFSYSFWISQREKKKVPSHFDYIEYRGSNIYRFQDLKATTPSKALLYFL